jgi:hydrogenase/urease accessory protein HupE
MNDGGPLRAWWCAAAAVAALLTFPHSAGAHALNPSLLDLEEDQPGVVRVVWKVTVSEVTADAFTPALPGCTDISPHVSTHVGVGIVSSWTTRCFPTLAGTSVGVRGLSGANEEALLRVKLADGRRFTTVLRASSADFTIPAKPAFLRVIGSYASLGIDHIASGTDHLAFVLGLVLLIGIRRQLLAAVTAFTGAHSITLALATLGVVHVPSGLTEALIALSILFLAVEVARPVHRRSPWAARRPWTLAFAFGLLHGLGFAGALADVGLPAGEIPYALLAFNVGVEVGQVAFILAVIAVATSVRAILRPWAIATPAIAVRAGTWVIGSAATYWTLDRVATFWS